MSKPSVFLDEQAASGDLRLGRVATIFFPHTATRSEE
jgi:hypothetical protein